MAHIEREASYDGLAVAWGPHHKQDSVEACAQSCKDHKPGRSGGEYIYRATLCCASAVFARAPLRTVRHRQAFVPTTWLPCDAAAAPCQRLLPVNSGHSVDLAGMCMVDTLN